MVLSIKTKKSWNRHFGAEKSSGKLVVVEFYAPFIKRCKVHNYRRAVHDLDLETENAVFLSLHVNDMKDKVVEYAVKSFPAFILFKNNVRLDDIEFNHNEDIITQEDFDALRELVYRYS